MTGMLGVGFVSVLLLGACSTGASGMTNGSAGTGTGGRPGTTTSAPASTVLPPNPDGSRPPAMTVVVAPLTTPEGAEPADAATGDASTSESNPCPGPAVAEEARRPPAGTLRCDVAEPRYEDGECIFAVKFCAACCP
jgi:hypothetical protein